MQIDEERRVPSISVIIPTHNRWVSLQRTLAALGRQAMDGNPIEVVVVADGCTDETVEQLVHYPAPFTLRSIVQAGQGAAAARNRGAADAHGQILLFLDDDIEPTTTLVEAHIAAHQQQPGGVVIGAYPPVAKSLPTFFQSQLLAWWEQKFRTLAQHGHRFTYRDLLSGNLSLAAELFRRLGGFDETISDCGGEDYEFGVRLLQADIPFIFVAGALGYHDIYATTDLDRSYQRARQEGRVDVRIGQRHPALHSQLGFARFQTMHWPARLLLRLFLFQWPRLSDRLANYAQYGLGGLERWGCYTDWQTLYRFLHSYWYWRGVADKMATWSALMQFAGQGQTTPVLPTPYHLDLLPGLVQAAEQLDAARPEHLLLYYGKQPVGLVPPQPGAERLRGAHLYSLLLHTLAVPYLEALVIEGTSLGSPKLNRQQLFCTIRAKSRWFALSKPDEVWYEQYSQWAHLEQSKHTLEESSDPNWEQQRKLEYELAWLRPTFTKGRWRLRLYHLLYRWHEPLYHWYSNRGWTWLTKLRAWTKQLLTEDGFIHF